MSFITSPGIIVPPLTAGGVAYGTGSQAKMNSAGTVGQVLTSAGAGTPTWAAASGGFTLGAAVPTTSGNPIEITGMAAGANVAFVSFQGVSTTTGADRLLIQLGTSVAYITTGYLGGAGYIASTLGSFVVSQTNGFLISVNSGAVANSTWSGLLTLTLLDSATNTWCAQGSVFATQVTGQQITTTAGRVVLTNPLSKIQLTTAAGSDSFDAGSFNVSYS